MPILLDEICWDQINRNKEGIQNFRHFTGDAEEAEEAQRYTATANAYVTLFEEIKDRLGEKHHITDVSSLKREIEDIKRLHSWVKDYRPIETSPGQPVLARTKFYNRTVKSLKSFARDILTLCENIEQQIRIAELAAEKQRLTTLAATAQMEAREAEKKTDASNETFRKALAGIAVTGGVLMIVGIGGTIVFFTGGLAAPAVLPVAATLLSTLASGTALSTAATVTAAVTSSRGAKVTPAEKTIAAAGAGGSATARPHAASATAFAPPPASTLPPPPPMRTGGSEGAAQPG